MIKTGLKIESFSDFEKILSEIGKQKIVFVSVEKYWTEGLEKYLNNFTRVFFDRSDEESIISVYDELKNLGRKISTLDVLKTQKIESTLGTENDFKLLTFKPKKAYKMFAEKLGGEYLLWQNLEISDFLENKIKVGGFFEKLKVKYPRSEDLQLSEDKFNEIKEDFGLPFVLQLQFSAAGEGTFMINSKQDFEKVLEKNSGRKVKIMEFIRGQNLTINACTSPNGTILSQGIAQITGIPELVDHSLASCGTDFSFEFSKIAEKKIWEITKKIGDEMREIGFRGIFGVDFIWDGEEIYTIEINPRMVASIPVFTKLEIEAKRIPLLAFHYLELLNIDFDVSSEVFERSKEKVRGSHIFLKNIGGMREKILELIKFLENNTPLTPLKGRTERKSTLKIGVEEKIEIEGKPPLDGRVEKDSLLEEGKTEKNSPLEGGAGGVHSSAMPQLYLRDIENFQKGENFGRVYFGDSVLEKGNTTKLAIKTDKFFA